MFSTYQRVLRKRYFIRDDGLPDVMRKLCDGAKDVEVFPPPGTAAEAAPGCATFRGPDGSPAPGLVTFAHARPPPAEDGGGRAGP